MFADSLLMNDNWTNSVSVDDDDAANKSHDETNLLTLLFSPPQTGIVEMTWVISDYVAAQGSAELSVQKGQQVEVIDTNCLGAPEVRT